MVRRLVAGYLAFSVTVFVGAAQHASGHEWLDGKTDRNGQECCNEIDCVQIPPSDVVSSPRGYLVQHPRIPGAVITVPLDDVQPSEDGEFWVCIHLYGGQRLMENSARCFFAPPGAG